MADIAIFRINYKSDFILTLNSDAGWMTPFCIKFWTGAPSQAYFVGYDGTTYTHCAPVDGEPTKLLVQFDDHHLPIGDLKFQIGYHFTVADFPTSVEDEVLNQASVIIEVDDVPAQVMLDLNGETAPEIEFSLPAYANEAQRIANEEQRIAAEQQRIANEDARIQAEETRQYNEQQRINQETARVSEFATLKSQSQAATRDANNAAVLANDKAQLAADKAALAQAAATLANEKAQLAADKAALANAASQLANEKAALAQQKAEYAQTQGDYAKAQGDYAKEQGEIAEEDHERSEADHTRAESDHATAGSDHTQAGTDHTRAESDHATASADHTQAGQDHTRAESDHTQATSDHTQAGTDHTRAESDHAAASADHTQAGTDHTRAESDHTRAESDHAAVELYVDSLGAFDISAYHATGGVLDKYADLTAALGTNGANIPEAIRKGGMSVKFVLSSDNKYVQYRLMPQNFTTDVSNWEEYNSNTVEGKVFYVTDANRNIIAKLDKDGVHSVDFKIGEEGESVANALRNIATQISNAVAEEENRAKAVEATKLNAILADDTFYFTDANDYIIAKIDADGVHSVNIEEEPNKIKNDKIIVTDNNGYIVARIDKDGIHSAKDKYAVACMVLSEAYYPTAAPTRDSDGNVTYAQVMFETGITGSISITYTNGNSSSVAVVYGDYNYTITINRDTNGNVETVNVQ